MTNSLEIILCVHETDASLVRTVASLVSQTDRNFEVLISDNFSTSGREHLVEAVRRLQAEGMVVRLVKAPMKLKRVEHWNWIHSHAQADWLKPLLCGDVLYPDYVAKLRSRLGAKPQAHLVRCDIELHTDWGREQVRAPFETAAIDAAHFGDYFPAQIDWLSRISNVAYRRLAWLATGGFSPQLPGFSSLNFNVILALHYGLENIAENLVMTDCAERLPLNESAGERVNFPLELWLILRQARNYCLASKVPWRAKWPALRAFTALLGRW